MNATAPNIHHDSLKNPDSTDWERHATTASTALASDSISRLIANAYTGEPKGWDRVYTALYAELHHIAIAQLRQTASMAKSSPTSLITEAWLRITQSNLVAANKKHLVNVFGMAMRNALLDEARRVFTQKRGSGCEHASLDESNTIAIDEASLEHLLAVDRALKDLSRFNRRLGLVVELRYFGGMSDAEIADMLDVTPRTVGRDWRRARAFLATQLDDPEGLGQPDALETCDDE